MKRTKYKSKTPSQTLRAWMEEHFDVAGCEPLIDKLCGLEDDLTAVNELMATATAKERPSLLRLKMHLLSQYNAIWKTAGLADDNPKNPVGRPPGT